MPQFFLIARIIRTSYKSLRAAVGIMIVAHGTYQWIQQKRRKSFRSKTR